jgi:hypothetical protein
MPIVDRLTPLVTQDVIKLPMVGKNWNFGYVIVEIPLFLSYKLSKRCPLKPINPASILLEVSP